MLFYPQKMKSTLQDRESVIKIKSVAKQMNAF